MARASTAQTNFTAGELSPKLLARSDIARYQNGCEVLQNFIVHPHGGAPRRSGTKYAAEVKDSTKKVRLMPFEFNTEQAYMLEFGDKYIRFYKDNAQILDSGSPYEIISPYLEAELFDIVVAQSADVMWITHNNVKIQKLSRTADTSWTLTNYAPTGDVFTGTDQTITGATQADPCVITIVGHNYSNGDRISIESVGGMTELNGKVYNIANVAANTFELEGIDSTAFTPYTTGGTATKSSGDYPGCVTFFEQRLAFARTNNNPHKIWTTDSADYETMTAGTADDNAIAVTIASGKVNSIRWLVGGDDLLIGTSGSEHIAKGSSDGPITPTNISIKRQTTHKCSTIQPVQIDNTVVFVQRTGRKLREMGFDFNVGQYKAPELSILSEHITKPGLVQLDYQTEPNSILWGVRSDGVLMGMTYVKDQEVIAFHRHVTDGTFESIGVIPASDHDQLWVVVNRTINGSTVRYVEYMDSGEWTTDEDAFYVDSGITYSGASTTTITGLTHLEGETVNVYGDGSIRPTAVVANSQITVDPAIEKAQVGLAYTSQLDTLEPEAGNPNGTAQGKTKRNTRIRVRFYKTLGGEIDGEKILYQTTNTIMGSAPDLRTGDYDRPDCGYSSKATISITTSDPGPMTVLGVYSNLDVADD